MLFQPEQEVIIHDKGVSSGQIRHWLVVGKVGKIIRKPYPSREIYDVRGMHIDGEIVEQRLHSSSLRPTMALNTNKRASILLDGDYE